MVDWISESPLVEKDHTESEYECIRCGYHTKYKSCMKTHLYKKKNPCPGIRNQIPMTDSVRDEILKNRKYEIRKYDNPNPIINEYQNWFWNLA